MRTFQTRPVSGKKGHGTYVSLAAALSEVLRLHEHILCTFQTRPALVPDSSWAHSRRISDECKHYFEAELYFIYLTTAEDLQRFFE